jgi:hypothetical protein
VKEKRKDRQKEHNTAGPNAQLKVATTDVQKPSAEPDTMAVVGQLLADATGVDDPKVAALIIDQVRRCSVLANHLEGLEVALEMMREMKPESLMEAQLAAQMHAVHNTAIAYLAKATSPCPPFAGSDANVARAIELMRLYREMSETMLKLKGQTGQQKVVVEHVHVHEGGQAIAGAVSALPLKNTGGSES